MVSLLALKRFLAALACLAAATAQADAVDDFIREEMASHHMPGLELAVVRDGVPVKVQSYGLANVELQVPVRRETVFQSGSVGKQFTAAAILLLAQDGKLTIDDPVGKHLPAAPKAWEKVTLRHLLTHTSGVWDRSADVDLRREYPDVELLKLAFSADLLTPPGYSRGYSNLGYVVLGLVVAKVSGKSYGEFLRERIFEPLGMKAARIVGSDGDLVPNRASGYRMREGTLANQEWVSTTFNSTGDGALYVTVDDLVRWDAALYTDVPLTRASREAMWAPVKTGVGSISEYGFGWYLDGIRGHRRVHHAGAWQGFNACIQRYVDDKLTVIVLANLRMPEGTTTRMATTIANLYFEGKAR